MNQTNIPRVVLWMAGALLSFCAMAIAVRELSSALNVFEIFTLRSGSGVIVLSALALLRPDLRSAFRPRRILLHATRNIIHIGAQLSWAQSIIWLPFATVFALEFSTPIWVTLLAAVLLGERLTASRAATVILGFVGVLVIVRPGFSNFQPATLMVFTAAFGFAAVYIATKKLTATESALSVIWWMNVMQFPINLAGSDLTFFTRLEFHHALPLAALVVTGLSSHFCVTNAFRWGDATVVVPLDLLRLPLITVVGWMFYGERVDAFVFAGAALIIASIAWNLVAERRRQAAQSR